MRLIIAGSRIITLTVAQIEDAIDKHFSNDEIKEVFSGGAIGVDRCGEHWANANGIDVKVFKPDYVNYPGKLAPKIRNQDMALQADALLAFWDGTSGGTAHMIATMVVLGKKVVVIDEFNRAK